MPVDPSCVVAALLVGPPCVVTQVDALAAPAATEMRRFVLLPANEAKANDLEYREFARITARAMEAKGFVPANLEDTDLVVFLSYAIDGSRRIVSSPVYGRVETPSGFSATTRMDGSGSRTQGSVSTWTTYERTGTDIKEVDQYSRAIVLTALDAKVLKEQDRPEPVWRISASSTGSSQSLREVFPVMMASMDDYIGTRSPPGETVRMSMRNKEVSELSQ